MEDAQAREQIEESLNEGALVMNYLGHGSVELWRGDLLTAEEAEGLRNASRLPLVVSMTCLNGYFDDIYTESLAEALMKAPNGGAVGVWASSGLTNADGQASMSLEFIKQLFNSHQTVGEAILKAKAAVKDLDVQKTWIYFGDPTMKLSELRQSE